MNTMCMDQLNKENADLNEKNDLLSPADWITFLSWEIYDEKNTTGQDNTTPIIALLVTVAFSILFLMFAAPSSNLPDETVKDILVRLIFVFLYCGNCHALLRWIYLLFSFMGSSKGSKKSRFLEKDQR